MDITFILAMLAVGAGVGIVSAALGIGGGTLMVPVFLWVFPQLDMNTAKGSSLFVIVFVAAYNAWRMNRGKMRNPWDVVIAIAAGSIAGGYAGGFITSLMDDVVVTWIFIGLLLFAALRTFFLEPPPVNEEDVRTRRLVSVLIGFTAGVVAGATGTGGGAILVPLALWAGIVSNARVVALSNTVMIGTAAAGTLAHAFAERTVDMPWTYGLVNVAFAPLVFVGALSTVRLGRRINARLSLPRRRVIMGVLLVVIAARLIYRVTA